MPCVAAFFSRVEEAECGRSGSLRLVVGSGSSAGTRVILHTPRAKQIAALLTKYLSIETPVSTASFVFVLVTLSFLSLSVVKIWQEGEALVRTPSVVFVFV